MAKDRPEKLYQSTIRDVRFGEKVTVVEPVNIYECKIGDNSFVGPFVEIQKLWLIVVVDAVNTTTL